MECFGQSIGRLFSRVELYFMSFPIDLMLNFRDVHVVEQSWRCHSPSLSPPLSHSQSPQIFRWGSGFLQENIALFFFLFFFFSLISYIFFQSTHLLEIYFFWGEVGAAHSRPRVSNGEKKLHTPSLILRLFEDFLYGVGSHGSQPCRLNCYV